MRTLLFVLAVVSIGADAGDYKPLTGAYSIAGKTLLDPPTSEAQNTHIYFSLNGKAALDLYDSMKTKAISNACANDGSMLKRVGEMQCTRSDDGKEYQCWFGIDIKNQKVVGGVVC